MFIDNQGKGKETNEGRVEQNYKRGSENTDSHSKSVKEKVNDALKKKD